MVIRKLLSCVGKYKAAAILAPITIILEVILETQIPLYISDIVDTGIKQPFAYYWVETVMQEDNTTTQMLTILYNCMATEGDVESNTLEDEVEAKEMALNLTCTPSTIAKDNASGGNGVTMARIIRTEDNATWFDTYKTKVLLPTDSAGGE